MFFFIFFYCYQRCIIVSVGLEVLLSSLVMVNIWTRTKAELKVVSFLIRFLIFKVTAQQHQNPQHQNRQIQLLYHHQADRH